MSFNISTSAVTIESNVTATAQSCMPPSTGTNDDLFKLSSASALLLCAVLASGFIGIVRAIRAMHADLVKLVTSILCDDKTIAPSRDTGPIQLTTETDALGGHPTVVSSESSQAEMSSQDGNGSAPERTAWGRVWSFALICLEQCSAAATTVAASGMLLGAILDVEEEGLPSPVTTPSHSQQRSPLSG